MVLNLPMVAWKVSVIHQGSLSMRDPRRNGATGHSLHHEFGRHESLGLADIGFPVPILV